MIIEDSIHNCFWFVFSVILYCTALSCGGGEDLLVAPSTRTSAGFFVPHRTCQCPSESPEHNARAGTILTISSNRRELEDLYFMPTNSWLLTECIGGFFLLFMLLAFREIHNV
jgi:hypothetical protein